jgi:hypothetical protein
LERLPQIFDATYAFVMVDLIGSQERLIDALHDVRNAFAPPTAFP